MTDLREKNGRENPWNVKFWGIGNEAWGCGGNMTAEHYADVYRQYATFMTNWNNSERSIGLLPARVMMIITGQKY